MSKSGEEYSWDGFSDDLKEAFLGFMAVNDLAETGVTAQLQVFGRTGTASAAAIINMARNVFLDWPITKWDMRDKETSLFHDFPVDLHITDIMCAV